MQRRARAPCAALRPCSKDTVGGDPNVNEPEWDNELLEEPFRLRAMRIGLRAGARELGATLYEIDPGAISPYHVHHGNEELLHPAQRSPRTPRRPPATRTHQARVSNDLDADVIDTTRELERLARQALGDRGIPSANTSERRCMRDAGAVVAATRWGRRNPREIQRPRFVLLGSLHQVGC